MINAFDDLEAWARAFCREVKGWAPVAKPETASHVLLTTIERRHYFFMFKDMACVMDEVRSAYAKLPMLQRELLRYEIAEIIGDWLDAAHPSKDDMLTRLLKAAVEAYREAGLSPQVDTRAEVR